MLDVFNQLGRTPVSVSDYLLSDDQHKSSSSFILRHDVDRMVRRAVAMAELEAKRSVRSTYYFRCSQNGGFPREAVAEISAMGHETGYHYECLSACRGNRSAALENFERNLASLRELAPCNTVAMHGAPLSRHNNQDLLVGVDLSRYSLDGDASLSFAAMPVAYFTDTGGVWNADAAGNFRDRVGSGVRSHPDPGSCNFAGWLGGFPGLVYISTHPERWASTVLQYGVSSGMDRSVNLIKRAVRRYGRSSRE